MKLNKAISLVAFILVSTFLLFTIPGLLALRTLNRNNIELVNAYDVVYDTQALRIALIEYRLGKANAIPRLKEWLGDANPNASSPENRPSHLRLHEMVRKLVSDPDHNLGAYQEANRIAEEILEFDGQRVSTLYEESRELYERILRAEIVIFLFSLLLVLLGVFTFRKQILSPLRSFIEVMDRLRNGDLSARWVGNRRDELGDMGRTINQLTQELELRRKERMEFIASVAHDIRNPLAAISAYCDLGLIRKGQMPTTETTKVFSAIKQQIFRLNRLTQDLLESAKQRLHGWQTQKGTFCLKTLAEEILALFEASNPNHKFYFHSDDSNPEINADRDRISQVLVNLVSNAVKYSSPNSPVDVSIGSDKARQAVYIEVADRGIGIPDEKKQKIFEKFTRLSNGEKLSEGTGLGLSIVREILMAHGGTISVHDRLGGGTTFRVVLPLREVDLARVAKLA